MNETASSADNGGGNNGRGRDDRDHRGRFVTGNMAAKGNPNHRRVAELRRAVLEAVTPNDITAIIQAMVKLAKAGDVLAAREVLNRVCGKPAAVTPEGEELVPLPPIVILGHPQTPVEL